MRAPSGEKDVPAIPDKPIGRNKPKKPSRIEPKPMQLDLWAAFAAGCWEGVRPVTSTGAGRKPLRLQ
jgi:hypothetical protein